MRAGFPIAVKDMAVGLLGGSFDPAHAGHVRLTLEAMKRFGLDRVWWLVSPSNPLKLRGPAPVAQRLARAREVMVHPRVEVTGLESRLGTRYTAQTIAELKAFYPGVRFVWLMGADNLVQFDQWDDWRRIMQMVPLGVLARPGSRTRARLSKAARVFEGARFEGAPGRLARAPLPAWSLINMPMTALSSSALRARGEWPQGAALPGGVEAAGAAG